MALIVLGVALLHSPSSAQKLLSIEVLGPGEVQEKAEAQYECIAHLDVGDFDVTTLVEWTVEPDRLATIEHGLVTLGDVDQPTTLTVGASYTLLDVTKTDELDVSVVVNTCEVDDIAKLLPKALEDNGNLAGASISGNTLFVGSPKATFNGPKSGAAWVYQRDRFGTWIETQMLLPADGEADELFGGSTDLDGHLAIISASEDDENAPFAGSAYIFQDDGDGIWAEVAKLIPSDGMAWDLASAVTISGDTAAIGAAGVFAEPQPVGRVYVFQIDGNGNWTEIARLVSPDSQPGDRFALPALDGDTMIVGQVWEFLGVDHQSAYVFERDELGDWIATAELNGSDVIEGDWFGTSGDISGDTVVIGAWAHNAETGAAYVFERNDDGEWVETAKLVAADAPPDAHFGWTVAISGSLIAVGANRDNVGGIGNSGSAYLFERGPDRIWTQVAKVSAFDAGWNDWFGESLALDGSTLVVDAWGDNNEKGVDAGASYVYEYEYDCLCLADYNGDGDLTILDFVAFQIGWTNQDAAADCDGDGVFNVLDFVCFQQLFQAGCD